MKTSSAAALSALLAFAAAIPMQGEHAVHKALHKRDPPVHWVTKTDLAYVTEVATETVWGSEAPSAVNKAYNGRGGRYQPEDAAATTAAAVTTSAAAAPAPAVESTPAAYSAPAVSAEASAAPVESAPAADTYVAPVSSATTSSVAAYSAPATTSAAAETYSASSAAAAPTSSADTYSAASSSSGSNPDAGKSYSGEVTYYTVGMGACGNSNTDTDKVVAISQTLFDKYTPNGNPNLNPLCGQSLTATYNGKTMSFTVADRCTGCAEGDLDMSEINFDAFTAADGRAYGMTWKWD